MDFVRIRMLKDEPGSLDGITTRTFYEGKEYDLPFGLADAFVNHMKCAITVPAEPEAKVKEKAPAKPKATKKEPWKE